MFSLYRAVFPFTYDWFVTNENLNVFSSNQFPASAAGPRRSSAALLCSFFIGCLFLGFCFLLSILNSFTSSLVILTELIWNRVYRTNVDGRNMPSESGKWIIWLLSAHRHDGLNPALSVSGVLVCQATWGDWFYMHVLIKTDGVFLEKRLESLFWLNDDSFYFLVNISSFFHSFVFRCKSLFISQFLMLAKLFPSRSAASKINLYWRALESS